MATWLAGVQGSDVLDAGELRSLADSLGLGWGEPLSRLDALQLVFASVAPDTAGWRRLHWRFSDWETLAPSSQVVVGTALARGWLVDVPWTVADTVLALTRGEAASIAYATRFGTLTFAVTNDLHGGIEAKVVTGRRPIEVGGIARIGAAIDSLRRMNPRKTGWQGCCTRLQQGSGRSPI